MSTDSAGARWLRCDLQCHSPFDTTKDYGEDLTRLISQANAGNDLPLREVAEQIVIEAAGRTTEYSTNLIALTDHNSIDGYSILIPHLEEEINDLGEEASLVILPGVEFSIGTERTLHILVLFEERTSADSIRGAIQAIFAGSPTHDPDNNQPLPCDMGIDDFVARLNHHCHPPDGSRILNHLVVPAHIESDAGIWETMRGRLRQRAFRRPDWHGFQTNRPYHELPETLRDLLCEWLAARRAQSRERLSASDWEDLRSQVHWPLIETSDAGSYGEIGTRYTWMKMDLPSLEGVRLALLDPESRLRRMDEGPPLTDQPRLTRLVVQETDFFDELNIGWNPCLNVLIGGRGTGKSTVVEYIRYALGRARDEDFRDEDRVMYDQISALLGRKSQRDYGQTPGTLLPEHSIQIAVDIGGSTYVIKRDDSSHSAHPLNEDGSVDTDISLEPRALIRPRILSQGQIASIARDPVAQRRELEALADPGSIREFLDAQQSIHDQMEHLQVARRDLEEKSSTLTERQTELRTVEDNIAYLETGANPEILGLHKQFQDEREWFERVLDRLSDLSSNLAEHAEDLGVVRDGMPDSPDGPSRELLQGLGELVDEGFAEAHQALVDVKERIDSMQARIQHDRNEYWLPEYETARTNYESLRETMEERGVQLEQHNRLLEERMRLRTQVEDLTGVTDKIVEVNEEISELRATLVQLYQERYERRLSAARHLEDVDADVRVDVIAFGDSQEMLDRRDVWFAGAGLQHRDWEVLVDYVFGGADEPVEVPERLGELVMALRTDAFTTGTLGRSLERDECAVISLLENRGDQVTGHFLNALTAVEIQRLDEMERFLPEDHVGTFVRATDGEFKPITQGSLGERTTAILALVLATGSQPLIIDQPEEDLDNRYVYEVVVDLLRKRKFDRQILLSTHNANVCVNGDAELILALTTENRLGVIESQGSIDRTEVKQAVSEIMEGSEEAFRLRRERYGF